MFQQLSNMSRRVRMLIQGSYFHFPTASEEPKSIVALALTPVKGLCGIICDGAFASYKEMARAKAGQVGANLTTDKFSTIASIDQIANN